MRSSAKLACARSTALALLAIGAAAQERFASPTGDRYVLLDSDQEQPELSLCEVHTSQSETTHDRVLLRAALEVRPRTILVPNRLTGALLLDDGPLSGRAVWGSIAWINAEGQMSFRYSMLDLIDRPKYDPGQERSLWRWERWIDEDARSALAISPDGRIREVKLADGELITPTPARLLQLAESTRGERRALVLHVISQQPPEALDEMATTVWSRFFSDENPLGTRLRAGRALARSQIAPADQRGAIATLFERARTPEQPPAIRRYALRQLPDVLGARAYGVLRTVLRERPKERGVRAAFVAGGEPVVPMLLDMLRERAASIHYRACAATALHSIAFESHYPRRLTPPSDSTPASHSRRSRRVLLDVIATDDSLVADPALAARAIIGGPSLADDLITLLANGTQVDERIADALTTCPTSKALPAIDAALARDPAPGVRRQLRATREICRKFE